MNSAPSGNGRPAASRVANVDVLRAFAAVAVLGVHAYFLGGRAAPIKAQYVYDVPLITLATGVWLFFGISGYVISKPFVDRLINGEATPNLVPYALRRSFRIFPLYWVALTAVILIDGAAGTTGWQFPLHYLLLNNLVPGREEALFSAAWTLTLELLFYVAVPLFALALRARWRAMPAERLATIVLASWAASVAFTVVADLQGDGQTGLWLRGSLPSMWQMFCPGMLLAIAPHLKAKRWRRLLVELPARPIAIPIILATFALAAVLGAAAPLRFGVVDYQLLVDASRPLFAVCYGLVIARALAAPVWRIPWLLQLGVVSYGIYLIHPVLGTFLLHHDLAPIASDTAAAFAVNTACLFALTVAVAFASWRWFERPAISLGRRLGQRWQARHSSTITAVRDGEMRRFWNARAREDAFYFVDTRQPYGSPDPERFWASSELVDYLLDGLGVKLHKTDTVLEIGCGIGRITRGLAERSGTVIALDVSDEMLTRAQALNPRLDDVRWVLGDGYSLDGIASETVDACVSVVVLQHVPDQAITLGYVRALGRVLRPGGWAALQVSNDPATHRPRDGVVQRAKALVGHGPRGQRHPAWLGSHVELAELGAAAREAGLELERVWGEGSQYCQVLLRKGRPA
jgi:peptidoglycan/LPS O-acetylase OafA/YrhL/SAM-dependent methyltransferase